MATVTVPKTKNRVALPAANRRLLIWKKARGMWKNRQMPKVTGDPWEAARGILRHRNIDPLRYQKQIRREWNRRTK